MVGGRLVFAHSLTVLASFTVQTAAFLDLRQTAVIQTLSLDTAILLIGSSAVVNITNSFSWSGGTQISSPSGISIRNFYTLGETGGILNLLSSCTSIFSGSGTTQYIQYAAVFNYGFIEYRVLSNGVQLHNQGSFTNAQG